MTDTKKGAFIVFEGIDGSGKSTQLERVSKALEQQGYPVYPTFEPSDGPIGALIRKMLSGKVAVDQRTIAMLFAADRTDHLMNEKNGIRKKVDQGDIVLCDRYYFSSYAYHASHVDMDWVIRINAMNAGILKPDLTIFVDADPQRCFERIQNGREQFEMYEQLDVMKQVRAGYLKAFEKLADSEAVAVVDGNQNMETVEKLILEQVRAKLGLA